MERITDLSSPPFGNERAVVTIGAYDGVHLGHRAVIAAVRAEAAALDARSVVVTFDRHPAAVVRPESAPKLLTNLDQRIELLTETGIDATVLIHFDEDQSHEEPSSFVQRVLIDTLHVAGVVGGAAFHFGRNRRGHAGMLRAFGMTNDFKVI